MGNGRSFFHLVGVKGGVIAGGSQCLSPHIGGIQCIQRGRRAGRSGSARCAGRAGGTGGALSAGGTRRSSCTGRPSRSSRTGWPGRAGRSGGTRCASGSGRTSRPGGALGTRRTRCACRAGSSRRSGWPGRSAGGAGCAGGSRRPGGAGGTGCACGAGGSRSSGGAGDALRTHQAHGTLRTGRSCRSGRTGWPGGAHGSRNRAAGGNAAVSLTIWRALIHLHSKNHPSISLFRAVPRPMRPGIRPLEEKNAQAPAGEGSGRGSGPWSRDPFSQQNMRRVRGWCEGETEKWGCCKTKMQQPHQTPECSGGPVSRFGRASRGFGCKT